MLANMLLANNNRSQGTEMPLRWEELKNIQTGDKWFKVPDIVQISASASKARTVCLDAGCRRGCSLATDGRGLQALKEAQEDLRKSAQTPSKYRQPWQPPAIGKTGQASSAPVCSAQRDSDQQVCWRPTT